MYINVYKEQIEYNAMSLFQNKNVAMKSKVGLIDILQTYARQPNIQNKIGYI